MCQSGKCKSCNKCNPCGCGVDIDHFFVKSLPTNTCPHSMYFVNDGELTTYVTDKDGVPYVLSSGGSGGDISIISPQNTLNITRVGNQYRIDVADSTGENNIIESITFNGSQLIVDSNKNVNINAIESVSGNIVNNTDSNNPIIDFTASDFDLDDFNNSSSNPFVRQDDGTNNHNSLQGIQGGNLANDEAYHLSEGEHEYLIKIVDSDIIGSLIEAVSIPPKYVEPVSSITDVSQLSEVGSTINIDITQTFTQNDGGAKISEVITKNGTVVSNTNTYLETLIVPTTPVNYSGNVSYADGVIKNNNLGIPDPTGMILAGVTTSLIRTITPLYPVFYGVFETVPNANTLDFMGMSKMVVNSSGNITIPLNSSNSEYSVIAIPTTSTVKTRWYVTELNQGAIGGGVNLFGTPTTHLKNSPDGYWGGISYRIYITNYQTSINIIQLRNS